MKPGLFIVSILLCFCCCNQRQKAAAKLLHSDSMTGIKANVLIPSLPNGFKVDTVNRKDSSAHIEILISYPVIINTGKNINTVVKNELLKELDRFIIQLAKSQHSGISNTFDISTDYVYSDGGTVNYRFIITAYKYPAAHPFTYYKSFNYDYGKDQQIFFSDYFHIDSKQDSMLFRAVLNKQLDRPADFGIPQIGDICFNPVRDSVVFYFDDDLGENDALGINKATVSKDFLRQFIR